MFDAANRLSQQVVTAAIMLVLLSFAACAGTTSAEAPASQSATQAAEPSTELSPSSMEDPAPSEETPSDEASPFDSESASATGGPTENSGSGDETDVPPDDESSAAPRPTLDPGQDSGRLLKLSDFRSVSPEDAEFSDNSFEVAGKLYDGIGGLVRNCGEEYPVTLELRPGMKFQKLSFDVGQDQNNSEDPDQVLIARVVGDQEEYVTTKKTTIAQRAHVDAAIAGMVSVKILLYMDEKIVRARVASWLS